MPNIRNYFAAANTCKGFRSLFDSIFSPETLRRLYIIKGGSGTGKSRLIGDIAEDAVKRGLDIEKFYCSSDVSSLDGLLIPALDTAIVDGTAPHVTEAKYPGAVEIIIDLVQFMDIDFLASNKDQIIEKIKTKSHMYSTAYKYLAATEDINEAVQEILRTGYLADKAKASIERLFSEFSIGRSQQPAHAHTDYRYISSISSKGQSTLDTLFKLGARIITVNNPYEFGMRYMTELTTHAGELGETRVVFPAPLNPSLSEAVYLPDRNLVFMTVKEELSAPAIIKHINTERFIDKPLIRANRHKLRFAERCVETMMSGAFEAFSDAFAVHQSLEEIYIRSMDFSGKEALTSRISSQIFYQ